MNGLLMAAAVASLVPTGMALDHWAVQLRAFARSVWHLFVLWAQAVTSGLPVVGPLLAAAPGVHHGSPEEIEARRAQRAAFAEAERLQAETAAALVAEDETAAETKADDPEKTQPFKPYVVRGVA